MRAWLLSVPLEYYKYILVVYGIAYLVANARRKQ